MYARKSLKKHGVLLKNREEKGKKNETKAWGLEPSGCQEKVSLKSKFSFTVSKKDVDK